MTPKRNNQLEILDSWQNLTMLTTIDKVISKILVECLEPLVLKVVDQQEIGYKQGCYIIDNILDLKLGHEHAIATLQDVTFIKLDFEKAFNHMSHKYLWATLAAMNIEPFVISLIQGMVT